MAEEVQEFEVDPDEAVEAGSEIEVEAPEAEASVEAPQYDPVDAEEARLFGWKAPDEWVGDKPPGYIDDPKRFIDRVKGSRIFKAMDEIRAKEAEATASKLQRLEQAAKYAMDVQKQEYDRRLQEIEARQRRAVETADVATFDALERQKATMQPPPQAFQPEPDGPSPVVQEYAAKNEWVNDPVLRQEGAIAIDVALRSGRKFRDDAEQLEYAESVMRRKYPHVFQPAPVQQPAVPAVSKVDGGGIGGGATFKAGAFSKLPSEAISAFRKGVEQGLFTNDEKGKAEYARLYNEG
jgi:hypothetical protein